MSSTTMRARRATLAALTVGAALAGCTAEPSDRAAGRESTASATPSATASPSAAAPSVAAPVELRLAFAGDVHFTGRTLRLLDDPETAFGRIALVLRDADLTLLNLETAVTDRGTPQPKRFHFRAPETAYAALRAAGIDAASIANNHTLDYGQVGLLDTLDAAADADFPVFGAGRDADAAYAPWLTTVKGVRIAVLGMSQVHELAAQWKSATVSGTGRPVLMSGAAKERIEDKLATAKRCTGLTTTRP